MPFSDRLGTWLPVVVAFGLPAFFLPNLIDEFILPRVSLVIAGACLGAGLALLTPDRRSLHRAQAERPVHPLPHVNAPFRSWQPATSPAGNCRTRLRCQPERPVLHSP